MFCRGGGELLAEAVAALSSLRGDHPADADAMLDGWRELCPSNVPTSASEEYAELGPALAELLAQPFAANSGIRGVDELIALIVKLQCNVFEGGLFPLAACFNHSCAPNCAVALRQLPLPPPPPSPPLSTASGRDLGNEHSGWGSEGGGGSGGGDSSSPPEAAASTAWVYEVRTSRAVAAGAELCISYLGLHEQHLSAARRRRALAGWGFRCACARCASPTGGSSSSTAAAERALGAVRCTACGVEQVGASVVGERGQQQQTEPRRLRKRSREQETPEAAAGCLRQPPVSKKRGPL